MTENEFERLPYEYQKQLLRERGSGMLQIVINVDTYDVIGVKETLAEYLEKFGDVRVVSVESIASQTFMAGGLKK